MKRRPATVSELTEDNESMQKSIEVHGKTTDDAIAKGLAELGLERDDVSVEIIERGKKGVFGIGAVEAVVRLSYETPDEAPKPAPKPAAKPAPAAPKAAAPKPAPTPKPAAPKPAPAPKAESPKPAAADYTRPEGSQAEQTEAFLKGLLAHMGVQADIAISPRENGGLDVQLSGEHIGAVIGRRGETLDAIQYLTNYAVNRGSDRHGHINVDAENYRSKREDSLVRLAEKMAEKAIKYKRSMALEPMNSYERHVIHAALQDYEGVTTSSIGTEPNRRVVVSYVKPEGKKEDSDKGYKEWC